VIMESSTTQFVNAVIRDTRARCREWLRLVAYSICLARLAALGKSSSMNTSSRTIDAWRSVGVLLELKFQLEQVVSSSAMQPQ
jgi:hypothetical protein